VKEAEAYRGREQTYLKHFFLEKYLERVALNIGWSNPEFVYIDGFSGPWRSEDEAFEDTSFMIAVRQLRKVRDTLAEHDRSPRVRCIFVESDAKAFEGLERATARITDIDVRALYGEFESVLPEVIAEVGQSFALTFIDPTGWTGFALETIAPLLTKRGEVLVNFMFDFVNRFREDEREATAQTFNDLFGGPGWEEPVCRGEEAMLSFYRERLKERCGFDYATQTKILKPLSDRTYFHLVYATRHPKGLIEFRAVEKRLLKEQEHVRADAKQDSRIEKSGQEELFRDADAGLRALEAEVATNRTRAGDLLMSVLEERSPRRFEDVLPRMLETPMVDKSTAKTIMSDLRNEGRIGIDGMKPKQRLPDDGCLIRKSP
jgi:three-Cys-motif partner protein